MRGRGSLRKSFRLSFVAVLGALMLSVGASAQMQKRATARFAARVTSVKPDGYFTLCASGTVSVGAVGVPAHWIPDMLCRVEVALTSDKKPIFLANVQDLLLSLHEGKKTVSASVEGFERRGAPQVITDIDYDGGLIGGQICMCRGWGGQRHRFGTPPCIRRPDGGLPVTKSLSVNNYCSACAVVV